MSKHQPNPIAKPGWRLFLKLLHEARPPKLKLGAALLLSVVSTLVSLAVPLFTKNLVDSFSLADVSKGQIALLALVFVGQAAASGVSVYLLNESGQRIVANLRDRLWRKLLALTVPFYDRNRSGEVISRMTNDTAVVKTLITDHLTGFFGGIIAIVGSVAILLSLDWRMTSVMLLAVPLTAAILMPLGRKMHKVSKGLQDETARFTGIVGTVLSEIRLVKASGAEASEYRSGRGGIDGLFRFGMREARIQALIGPIVSLALMMVLVVIIGYGGMRVSTGALTAGELVAFILYLIQIVMPMGQITMFFTQFQKAVGATERIIETLHEAEEPADDGLAVLDPRQPITADNVSFAYEHGEPVLRGVSFTLPPGRVTAIVGPSGGGKTTLFSLLERFYAPQSGDIRLGGRPVGEFSLRSWRSRIGYVSQESPLIAGTIRDNLVYGLERDIGEAEIKAAAAMAYADLFIEAFPRGYDTEVGERGIKLSGGQRQRIAIARALLRDPAILMLDEATSSLDSKSEIYVQKALGNLMRGRTVLVIAHRLSTVADADQILFMEKGRITGTGTHGELFEKHELYREFAAQQLLMKQTPAADEERAVTVQ